MTWKQRLSFFSRDEKNETLVRIDGSLAGSALFEEGTLTRLREVGAAISASRPYTYDLELSAGRFSLIMLEAILPASAFEPDPETAIARDLQNLLDALPPQERTQVQSTFRALWHEGGDVMGVVFPVVPPGRVKAQKRIRSEDEYDRMAEEQALHGYRLPPKPVLPRWAVYLLGVLILAAGSVFIYYMSPERRMAGFKAIMDHVELAGLADLIEVKEFEAGLGGMTMSIHPLPGYQDRLQERLSPGWPTDTGKESALQRLAAEALVKGRLNLEVFDENGMLLDSVSLPLSDFDGSAPLRIRTRSLELSSDPARARIGP